MNTFILFWNPAISNYKSDDFQRELEETSEFDGNMNWSVWEHEKAQAGHRFFMVRCGTGNTGICMSGYFTSAPSEGDDWSSKGRKVYYIGLEPDVMIHPEYLPILTTKELSEAIPSFDWTGGHSGRLIDKQDADKLEEFWKVFTDKHKDIFTLRALRHAIEPSSYIEGIVTCFLSLTEDGKINVYCHQINLDQSFDTLSQAKEYALEAHKKSFAKNREMKIVFDHIDDEYQDRFFQVVEKLLSLHHSQIDYEVISQQQFHQDNILTLCLYYLVKYNKETLQSLRKQGFSLEVIEAVMALLKKEGETEEQYIGRIMENEIALNVKIDMLENELNISKLEKITVDDVERLNIALRAYHKLSQLPKFMVD